MNRTGQGREKEGLSLEDCLFLEPGQLKEKMYEEGDLISMIGMLTNDIIQSSEVIRPLRVLTAEDRQINKQ